VSRSGRWAVTALVVVACGCGGSDDSSTADATLPAAIDTAPTACAPADPEIRVDRVMDAIAAVEAERGGPQEYFEINANSLFVNLFVADTAAGTAVPYVYVGGALTHQDGTPAQGDTFAAADLVFDPQRVTSCVRDQLPTSSIDQFVAYGNDQGAVQLEVVTTSSQGGQLVVSVNGDGLVLGVDAVDPTDVDGTTAP
jgi:hypothetical protein